MITPKVIVLSGGVGGAKLAAGLTDLLPFDELLIIANTADDFTHLGLKVCPDLDSIMYALADMNDRKRGWGLANESWNFLASLEKLGGDTWFQLGDKDLATHVQRTHLLNQGINLSDVTSKLSSSLGIRHTLLPMSNDPIQTRLKTSEGELDFQTYFVARQCEPVVEDIFFEGIDQAKPHELLLSSLSPDSPTQALIICPSNPFVSVDPILGLHGIRDRLLTSKIPRVAISPLVGGKALKGPAAKMMVELDLPCNAYGIAQYYQGLLSHFVIDHADASLEPAISKLGMQVLVCNTIMKTREQQTELAQTILQMLNLDT